MNCHQVLSGACNTGDQCFAVGSVVGIPFTAYAAGCNIVILAPNFERVQVIPGAVHGYVRVDSLDCSKDTGKIAAAYGRRVCVFEPTPLIHTANTTHGVEYHWVQTGQLECAGAIAALSWNLEGTRLLTCGALLQLWHQAPPREEHQASSGVTFQIGGNDEQKAKPADEEAPGWVCAWQCHTATPAHHLAFSPDGSLFATCGINDRLVKIWYLNKAITHPGESGEADSQELNYGYIYVAHPRAVTHLSWRKTSKYMNKGSVGNVLVTSCVDNICRIWAETLLPEDEWGGGVPVAPRSPPRRHRASHRHKHRFMQRLKHMKTCFHIRRAAQSTRQLGAPIPTLPSTYSAHDFHSAYRASYTGGLHFHLAASISAETDIPLVPAIPGGGRFILHWLNNKEMHYTSRAEAFLHDLTKKVLEREEAEQAESATESLHHEPEHDSTGNSHPSLSNTTSVNSISTDVTWTHLPDSLDVKIESLMKDWYQSPDLLFSIHPVDASFLIWTCELLDEHGGTLRQAQVSFSARIPSALPLGDATTMCTAVALYYAGASPLYVRHRNKPVDTGPQQGEGVTSPLASVQEEREDDASRLNDSTDQHSDDNKEEPPEPPDSAGRKPSLAPRASAKVTDEDASDSHEDSLNSAPVISMVTNHTNGTLNLWQLTFDDKSKFSQVLSIGHASRASGHRFRVNDITCHPVLPLLLTTSHHNIADSDSEKQDSADSNDVSGLCSELILWRVEAVGPLGKSGGVSELARVNSPHLSAFSNVAWLPALLPSSTLGNLCNSPSACFVASDGVSLRVYQAVIDARTLLAEIASYERKHKNVMLDSMMSSQSSECGEWTGAGCGVERVQVVSQQSTARPGAVIQLHAIADATHDWHNTQLLHVFQQQLITGERGPTRDKQSELAEQEVAALTEGGLEAMVDLRKGSRFREPFYIVVVERTDNGSVVHMWRLTVCEQSDVTEELTSSMMYVPDSALVQEEEGADSRKNSVSAAEEIPRLKPQTNSHISIETHKVCECPLSLPDGVEVVHAAPAAGHLSSASIYPACLAPYILATACSDSTLRFWKCKVTRKEGGGEKDEEYEYEWCEWEMMNRDHESAIDVPGQPLHISAAYSGRIACAYKCGRSFTRPARGGAAGAGGRDDARFVNLCVAVYECESTGGAEWLLEDTIPLRNVSLPRAAIDAQIDMSYLYDNSFLHKKIHISQVLQTLTHEEARPRNGDTLAPETKPPGLLAVPSFSTLQSLRRSITENGNTCPLTQKHLVQLDWVSKEDGSHILTVAVGSRILLFTPVSSDLAQANLKAMKESINSNRPILRKASSLAAPLFPEDIRWMQLRKISLRTADGLPPLPMQISWVRDGILVVGMDSEMHVYSQWRPEHQLGAALPELEEASESRALRDADLRVSAPHLSRVSSLNLQLLEKNSRKNKHERAQPLLDYMPDYGLFEASQMACPVLPQYHPKQLMELLNSGKIRWVKAILAHLVRCIGGSARTSQGDEDSLSKQRGWSRSRTLSVSFAAGAASPLDGAAQITEDVQLDYAEITSVPPLPLWTLLIADRETASRHTTAMEAKDYNELFEGTIDNEEDLDDLLLDEEEGRGARADRRVSMPEKQGLSHFGPRQGRILSRLLTHTHLPGLSSLDQMHLLALADTVSTCDTDFADRFTVSARGRDAPRSNDLIQPDALDDCGLRFLLAMKHYGYLQRCLPLTQRAALQRVGVGTCNVVWAFHSESHEQLLALVPGMAKGQPRWASMRELGVGWWIRSKELLKTCIERLARAVYQVNQDPMDAALYYLAMRKKALLWGLFRSRRDEKMTTFFGNNFSDERWRKAALKNAFALLGKQRFEHAAAFFLLGGALKDALEVLVTRLGDLQLAMVVARLYEADSPQSGSLRKLLFDEILGGECEDGEIDLERAHPDPFVRSMALWELRRHRAALDTLLTSAAGRLHAARTPDPVPSVFNFYVYLSTHPRLHRHATQGAKTLLQDTEESITRVERRLYFQTAHGHFKAGCPALALEVLSKLPARVRDDEPRAPADVVSPCHLIHTGQLGWGDATDSAAGVTAKAESLDWGAPSQPATAESMDWGAPVASTKEDELVLDWDDDKASNASEASTPPLEMKLDSKRDTKDEEQEEVEEGGAPPVDIMAQQLKFVACLKILMEELSTLATGFEVDGGHLRYQLYIWLEREVEALRQLCNYAAGPASDPEEHILQPEPESVLLSLGERPTLPQLLLQEKMDFEAKVARAIRRKRWLQANETLVRTLLSYCSLQGAGGGGLASVRMELILLLQELGQDKQNQQLLSPLPFPTTLPLLAAAVAANKTVVADPVRHLQTRAHDMLLTVATHCSSDYCTLYTLRDLAVALSACIYQSLCDSDTVCIEHGRNNAGGMESLAKLSGVTEHNSHLMSRARRRYSSDEPLAVTTPPDKWPGVWSLRGLASRAAEEEDAPRLSVLLAESFVAVYLALLWYALAQRDAHLLYRLVAFQPTPHAHAKLFGGGVKRLLTTAQPPAVKPVTLERAEGTSVWSSLRAQRARLNMRLLGQAAPQPPHNNMKEGRPTYREQFVPPSTSILSFLLTKPSDEEADMELEYDSAESAASDEEAASAGEDDDVFDTSNANLDKYSSSKKDNTEHTEPDSYSWCVMRIAVLQLAQHKLQDFLQICGVEMSELATTSPVVHGALRRVEQWRSQLSEALDSRAPPQNYIPACEPDPHTPGPTFNKYKCLLEKHNTPFNPNAYSAMPARRLWTYLVHQEPVQKVFIRAVFARRRSGWEQSDGGAGGAGGAGEACPPHRQHKDCELLNPVRIIHKEQDSIAAFCLDQTSGGLLGVATSREVQEMDISLLLSGAACWSEDECETDLLGLNSDPATLPDTGFLVIKHKTNSVPGTGNTSPLGQNPPMPPGVAGQTGRGASVVLKHKIDNIKRMSAHPTLPLYVTGGADGSVQLWEWGHATCVWTPRAAGAFAKVTRVRFSEHGNKVAAADADGNLAMWQLGLAATNAAAPRPFFTHQCHSKGISDFVFLSSCSLLATAGHSSESKNVAIWDTLMPIKKALVVSWTCHEGGAACVAWAASSASLVSCGRRGDVCVWDVRSRAARHKLQAHDAPLKCIALAPLEDKYATGAADGDIKVWSLHSHQMLHWFQGEHARSSFFKHIGQGVTQLHIDAAGRMFSCGADGTMKVRKLPERDASAHHPHY